MPTIKLVKETSVNKEVYYIYKDDWCERLFTINADDEPQIKEMQVNNALKFYKELKESLLNPVMTQVILEDTI